METTKSSHSKTKAILLILSTLSVIVLISCIVLHVTPSIMANSIFDFATHHYFLMSFVSITVAAASYKAYLSLDKRIEENFQKKSIPYTRTRKKRILMFKKWWVAYIKKAEEENEFVKPEYLTKARFKNEDVLESEEARQQRLKDLQKATVLGNSFKQKVILMFKDYRSRKHLIATVWHSNSEHISLKGGITLPVKSIYKIEF